METHVSSTTADVPETQEVIGSHGNVEIVIAVEKVEEDIQQKADSNSQDNAQPVMEASTPTKTDGFQNSPSKPDLLQQSTGKEMNSNKNAQPSIKPLQSNKQTMIHVNKAESQTVSPDKVSGKPVGVVIQNAPAKEPPTPVDVDSTSLKDIPTEEKLDEEDNKDNVKLNTTVEREPSIESQSEMISDASEKEHNKSISRELKSLINSAKESKIISECTKLTSKTRKSRAALDASNSNIISTPEADSIQGNRRSSSNSQKSNSSEKSERVGKRSMRSQNPEFVNKVRQFLNSVTGKFQKGGDSDVSSASDDEMVAIKNKETATTTGFPSPANNRNLNIDQAQTKTDEKSNKLRSDPYCWRCHWSIDLNDGEKSPQPPLKCTVCPRAFHFRCLTGTERTKISSEKNWVCPECMTVLHAESSESRSSSMKKTSLGMLCELLKYALQRMTEVNGGEPFLQPVDRAVFPDYDKYVVHPMDLSLMKENISEGLYGSTEAFLADAHWILHNSIIFNEPQSKLTTAARALVRSCRAEMSTIEACPECYAAAHARRPTWFTDVCSTPHLLLWAKLKGFPYWPAKAMSVSHAGMVDVRFFGAHDRAWVPARDCYLYCERDPNNFRTKRQDIIDSMQEAEQHIRNISRKYGKFVYAPYRTTFDASKLEEVLKFMIPSFDGPVKSPIRDRRPKTPAHGKKSRSNSKGSKDDSNAGDVMSDSEPMDVETSKTEDAEKNEAGGKTPNMSTRKRQRSELKESLGAVADSSPKEKRGRAETDTKEAPSKTDSPLVSSSKELVQKPHEPHGGAPVEPIDVDSAPPDPEPARPAPNKPDTPAKPKNNPKTNNIAPSNKTPPKTDDPKIHLKEKNIQEEKISQNPRISRITKTLTNIETVELEQSNLNTSTPNKSPVITPNSTAKTYTNKNSPKESASVTKTNEKEKVSESAVLIKINEKGKESSVSIKVSAKDKLTEAATLTKITDIVKMSQSNSKVKEKEAGSTTPNKDSVKEKVAIATPVKNVGKVVNTPPVTPSNKNLASQKSNAGATAINTSENEKSEVSTASNTSEKEKPKDNSSADKTPRTEKSTDAGTESKKDNVDKEKSTPGNNTSSPKPGTSKVIKATKDRIQYDDDMSLAVIARKVPKTSANSDATAAAPGKGPRGAAVGPAVGPAVDTPPAPHAPPAPPTPPTPPTPPATRSSNAAKTKTTQITVEVTPDSSIFTPTSTENVRNMKEAVTKLQKLRSGFDPPANPQVGKVGVRAFARMTSPPEKQAKPNDVQVEIKSEPMDYEDSDAQLEPSTVLDSLRPRPIAPSVSGANLREVRISKVMPAPVLTKKSVKPVDVRPRAKKTFPQPKKPDDGRSELTNKNSMVYIPIQPPISQAPVRATLKTTMHAIGPATSTTTRPPALFSTTNGQSSTKPVKGVTSMAPPLLPMAPPPPPSSTATATSGALAGALLSPAFPSVPTTVHTVPLITSVNGQWTFSLQPVMSVGGSDSIMSATVNGVGERGATGAPASPAAPPAPGAGAPGAGATVAAPVLSAPAASQAPALVPTAAPHNPPAATTTVNRTPDTPMGEPPRLQQRPVLQSPLAAGTEIGELTAPSAAGPLTAKLNQNSIKLAEFFRNLLEDSLVQVEEPVAEAAALRLQLEQERWRHQHELTELRHTHELLLVEVRSAMEKEKARAVAEARRLAHQELEAAVKNAKSKQWCANCSQEAQFYCCWNTSYCDYPCQRAHWAQHYASCTQQRSTASSAESRAAAEPAPPPPADAPKTTSAPSLTVASKTTNATPRIVNSEQAQNKSPVVVSALEERGSGASKGAAAAPQPASLHAAPLLANKQLISNEESGSKRVATSGGYLIVGAGAGAAVVAAPAPRRAPRRD